MPKSLFVAPSFISPLSSTMAASSFEISPGVERESTMEETIGYSFLMRPEKRFLREIMQSTVLFISRSSGGRKYPPGFMRFSPSLTSFRPVRGISPFAPLKATTSFNALYSVSMKDSSLEGVMARMSSAPAGLDARPESSLKTRPYSSASKVMSSTLEKSKVRLTDWRKGFSALPVAREHGKEKTS